MWLLLALVSSIAAQCVRDSFTPAPLPAFPTSTYSGSVGDVNSYVKGHWSQMVKLRRPTNTIAPSQSDCPHAQAGLDDWHNPNIWGGSPPADKSNVTIPAGKKVLISSCSVDPTWVFNYIEIPADSALIFGDANIAIQAKGFINKGSLLIGSPTCRLTKKITITLHGKRGDQALPAPNYVKAIWSSGKLDIHGAEFFPTWTRLASTAKIGDSTIFIQDCPNWQPGQTIVLTTTELKDSRDWHRNEKAVIASVQKTTIGPNTCAVTLTAPLLYKHYGGFEYQAEVALLSRNILIQGDPNNSEPTDTANVVCNRADNNPQSTYPCTNQFLTGFGFHIIMTSPSTIGRVAGVELFRGGQTNVLGRYVVHWHHIGNVSTPGAFYGSDNAVHHSFFRCFTIHGTSGTAPGLGVTLTKNVGYDIIGHCFFCSEEGIEENSTISYNLGAFVHPLGPYWQTSYGISEGSNVESSGQSFGSQYTDWVTANSELLLADDIGASPYYFTNAYSDIVGNAASGGWAGFAFPNAPAPIGANYLKTYFVPKNRPLYNFLGNSAHSTGYWQGHAAGVYVGGNLIVITPPTTSTTGTKYTLGRFLPARDTCNSPYSANGCPEDQKEWMKFYDTKVFLSNIGLQSWGDREQIVGFEVHDVRLSTNVFGEVWINQMLVNCRTGNIPIYLQGCNPGPNTWDIWNCNERDRAWFQSFGGFEFYDTGQSHLVTDSIFQNCRASPNPACNENKCDVSIWRYLTHSDQFTPGLMQQTSNITYYNVDLDRIAAPSTAKSNRITVSGRASNWLDQDGTVFPGKFPGERTMIGSSWTGDWWKYNSRCALQGDAWICPMCEGDSLASVVVGTNPSKESQIGSSYCSNGPIQWPSTYLDCPFTAKAVHFGRDINSASQIYDVSLMGRLTGPVINSAGGWYINFPTGTPTKVSFTEIQIEKKDSLLIAVPYPAGVTVKVYAQAPTWCTPGTQDWSSVCTHPYYAVTSIADVLAGYGDKYFLQDMGTYKMLYFKLVNLEGFGYQFYSYKTWIQANKAVVWGPTTITNSYFSRDNLNLLNSGSSFWSINLEVTSGNCNPFCSVVNPPVPAELKPGTCVKGQVVPVMAPAASVPPFKMPDEGPVGPPATDCTYGPYQIKSGAVCTKTCGGGTIDTIQPILTQATNGGYCKTEAERSSTQACNTQACPAVDCTYGPYEIKAGAVCTKTCGSGTIATIQPILTQASNGGYCKTEAERSSTQACNTQACAPPSQSAIGRITWFNPNNAGACGFTDFSSIQSTSIVGGAAMCESFINTGIECGQCYRVVGPTETSATIMVSDFMSTADNPTWCSLTETPRVNHFDLAGSNVFNRFVPDINGGASYVTYEKVPCPITGPIKVKLHSGTNKWWTSFTPMNFRIGIQTLAVKDAKNSTLTVLKREWQNSFQWGPGREITFPVTVTVTSINGQTVDIVISATAGLPGAVVASTSAVNQFTASDPPASTLKPVYSPVMFAKGKITNGGDRYTQQSYWESAWGLSTKTMDATNGYCATMSSWAGWGFGCNIGIPATKVTGFSMTIKNLGTTAYAAGSLKAIVNQNWDKTIPLPALPAGAVTTISIPVASMNLKEPNVRQIEFQNAQPTLVFCADNVKWVLADASQPTYRLEEEGSGPALPVGAIVGIAVGAVALLLIVIALGVMLRRSPSNTPERV